MSGLVLAALSASCCFSFLLFLCDGATLGPWMVHTLKVFVLGRPWRQGRGQAAVRVPDGRAAGGGLARRFRRPGHRCQRCVLACRGARVGRRPNPTRDTSIGYTSVIEKSCRNHIKYDYHALSDRAIERYPPKLCWVPRIQCCSHAIASGFILARVVPSNIFEYTLDVFI